MPKRVHDWTEALKPPVKIKPSDRSMLALEIPRALHSQLRELAARLGAQEGERVLLTDLLAEALELLFAKYARK